MDYTPASCKAAGFGALRYLQRKPRVGPTGYTPCECAAYVGDNYVVLHRITMHSRSNLRSLA